MFIKFNCQRSPYKTEDCGSKLIVSNVSGKVYTKVGQEGCRWVLSIIRVKKKFPFFCSNQDFGSQSTGFGCERSTLTLPCPTPHLGTFVHYKIHDNVKHLTQSVRGLLDPPFTKIRVHMSKTSSTFIYFWYK